MRAMVLGEVRQQLVREARPIPVATDQQVLVKVLACAVCRTDLHVLDGEQSSPKVPLIPGHEVVGVIVEKRHGAAQRASCEAPLRDIGWSSDYRCCNGILQ